MRSLIPTKAAARLLATSSILFGCTLGAQASAIPVGAVQKAQGQAQAAQGGAVRDLSVEAPVLFGDRLQTGTDARLEAKLADGTVLTLGQRGRLNVDKFVYDPDRQGGRLALSVPQGAFLFVGGKIEGPTGGNVFVGGGGKMGGPPGGMGAITRRGGTLGVRGTTVWGGQIDGGFGVLVLSGEVSVKTPRGEVLLQKGQGTMVYGNHGPAEAAPWPEDRVKRAVATISFAGPPASTDPNDALRRALEDLLKSFEVSQAGT